MVGVSYPPDPSHLSYPSDSPKNHQDATKSHGDPNMPGTFTHSLMRTGPAVVYFGGTCLGVTLDGQEWRPEIATRERTTSRWGRTPVDVIHLGERHTVVVRLAESSVAVLEAALPHGETADGARHFGRAPGGALGEHAATLLLRPADKDAEDDDSEDAVFHKAVATDVAPVGWTHERERIFQVTFTALVDESKDDGKKIGYVKGG